ncbi:hypothetical protein SCHPADRAFT_840230 [Schizopora paradoxa]|uniref:Complex 1 LYR protein domain-containing protein n=2 Tax=Schizopora paradoxa TaxID=27342 RepID=A0A0H2QYX0_9AGAM|nr:hypothetical protein SCHPADRAFT_840230 [Schizopora paradoxa]
MSLRKSGLQREVLALYRRALRIASKKPAVSQDKFRTFFRYNFHVNAQSISPRNINAIEHLLRKGRRQLEQLEDPAVTDCWVGNEMKEWEVQHPGRRR